MLSPIACAGVETITQTVKETQSKTLVETKTMVETEISTKTQSQTLIQTQKQTVTQTATLTEEQKITVTTTVYTSSMPTTTTPPVSTSTPPTNGNPAAFTVSDLAIEPRIPSTGVPFSVSVTVTNTGSSQGTYDATLYVNRLQIDSDGNVTIEPTETFTKSVIVTAGESKIIAFERLNLQDGHYTVSIGELEDYVEVGS